ncbi:hypothetical protein JW930_07265 [Candidatus Woesearchaeota archaeon]|nr:hypothetical protein [Candidatus Woesearchaeota archaeon]
MQKRATSQIDWAISLGVFVLFIAWFFVFVQPNLQQRYNKQTLMMVVRNNFERDYLYTVENLPLFITSASLGEYKPVTAEFYYKWDNFKFKTDEDYFYDGEKLVFLANLTDTKTVFWIQNNINYSLSSERYDLMATEDWATTSKNLSVYITDSMVDDVYYKGRAKINNSRIYLNDILYSPINISFNESPIMAKYRANSPSLNFTTYVYTKNSILDTYVDLNDLENNYTVAITFNGNNYLSYYTDNDHYDNLTSSIETNASYNADQITFYDTEGALSVFFDRNVSLNLSYASNNVEFYATFIINDSARYLFVFHEGDYQNATREDKTIEYGIIEKIEGYSLSALESLNYTYLKEQWDYPPERDFAVSVRNTTKINESELLLRIGKLPTKYAISYSEEEYTVLISEEGETIPILLTYVVW